MNRAANTKGNRTQEQNGALAGGIAGNQDSSHTYGYHNGETSMVQHDSGNQSLVEKFLTGTHQDATLDKNLWVHDEKVKACTKCKKPFTFFYRKHHCRICGNVFCNNCTLVKSVVSKNKQESVRMCENCEIDLENYNRSLKTKNNLLNVDQRQSFQNSNVYSPNESPEIFSGAPRNYVQEEEDSENDEPKTVKIEDKHRDIEEQKWLEENKRRQAELDQANQGVAIHEYVNRDEDENKQDRTFSGLQSIVSGARADKEATIKHRLKEFSVYHIQQIVSELIKHYSIDQKKWGNKILGFVQNAVDNVRPSSRLLNDSMNFNSFIKIKIINWQDNSKSAYVNGVVLNKNIADKRMENLIHDPQILLLKESVGTIRGEGAGLTEIQSLVDQENDWIEIIRRKLTQIRPNIIIVEKDVGYKILDVLREAKITVITNLTSHKMKRIQRYTQTIISPSYNVIDKSFVLGKCKQFRVDAPFQGSQMQKMQMELMDPSKRQEANLVSNDRSLIYFEGTNPALGCTILLSGNVATELDELKKVKQALREMLKLARNVILERAFLLQLNCSIPKPIYDEKGMLNVSESPFLITKNIQNRQTLVMSVVTMKKGVNTTQNEKTPTAPTNLNVSQNMVHQAFSKAEMDESTIQQQQHYHDSVSPQVLKLAKAAADKEKVNENYVKTKIDSMCGCPKKEKMSFYVKEQDETIGKFLFRMSKLFSIQCDQCKETMYKHFIQYYHKDGCLELQIEALQQSQPLGSTGKMQQMVEKKQKDIIMRGICQHCKRQVTHDVVMTNTFYEYSKARFLEQFFYNGDNLHNMDDICNHKSLKDINRVFVMPGNYVITFSFIPLEVYQIEMIQPKKQDTTAIFKQAIEQRKVKMLEFINVAFPELKQKMHILLDFMKREKKSCYTKEMQKRLEQANMTNTINHFIKSLQIIKQRLSPSDPEDGKQSGSTFEVEFTHMANEIKKPIQDVQTIFEAMFLERKLLLNYLTFAKVLEETARIVCMLLALLRLRIIVLNSSLSLASGSTFDNSSLEKSSEFEKIQVASSKGLSANQLNERNPLSMLRRGSNIHDLTLTESIQASIQSKDSSDGQPKFSFVDDFITGQDLRQMQQQQQSTPVTGGAQTHPQNKINSQQVGNTNDNIETVKNYVNGQIYFYTEKLHKQWASNQEANNMLMERNAQQNIKFDEEEKGDSSAIRGSIHQNLIGKSQQATNLQNMNQVNLLQNEPSNILKNICHKQWQKQLNCGFVTMPLGTDHLYIPLNDNNIGSIISYVLSSNIYKEAMIKQNYMDIGSKIKAPNKHQRQPVFAGSVIDPSASQDNIRGSILGAATSTSANNPMTTQTSNIGFLPPLAVDEAIKLAGKDDVFNYELSPHQIETELLCGERLNFEIKVTTFKQDHSLVIEKNGQRQSKLSQTSMQFQTFKSKKVSSRKHAATNATTNAAAPQTGADQTKGRKKEEFIKNDLQDKMCSPISMEYMDYKNLFVKQHMGTLELILQLLSDAYFNPNAQGGFMKTTSPLRPMGTMDDISLAGVEYSLATEQLPTLFAQNTGEIGVPIQHTQSNQGLRESLLQNMRSPPIGAGMGLIGSTPNMGGLMSPGIGLVQQQMGINAQQNKSKEKTVEFCSVTLPTEKGFSSFDTLTKALEIPKIEYKLKVYFPKKFEALRRFYCGSQYDFIESLIQTQEWTTVSGGKTKSKFYRSFDDKYVFKEIKKSEFKMFLEFAPQYFDYLCKSFFHNYPCALCKILGAYKIKITTFKDGVPKITKKHIYITENLNYGIKPEDEPHIIRYDLKGSTLNRFVKTQVGAGDMSRVVLHDNNFQLAFMGRPLPIRYTINRILHICINNDTLCLSKSNIVDYSLLTIIDTKRKKVRFGIIDYVQQYTLDKIFEGKFKRIINRGEVPTIVDPDKYKLRFKKAMKRYFIGMVIQEDKTTFDAMNKQEQLELQLQQQLIADDHDSEDDMNDELNETMNAGAPGTKSNLNDTFTNISKLGGNAGGQSANDGTDHEAHGSEKTHHSLASPALQ